MFHIDIKLLAALAPAILCILLLAGCYVPRLLGEALTRMGKDEALLEWCSEVVLHAAFYGSVLSVIFGVETHSHTGEVIIAAWFGTGLWLSLLLSKRLSSLRATEREKEHQLLVSEVRSIVKNEMRSESAD